MSENIEIKNDINYKDIERFHEIRTDKHKLIKLRVDGIANAGYTGFQTYPLPKLWNWGYFVTHIDYYGPRDDTDTIEKINEFYKQKYGQEVRCSIVDVQKQDLLV